ncbi:hypothetical protein F0L68_40030 [Solihabitans fulvus]|uniref:Secreted protein n=1 Tax=Solihabitans fulvus TaxID=1892852 RepID=A0A5B2W8R5_9PSEU|nr:hypothetical protein F0L68_40030 [Solihabitans fulvus]
MEGTAPLARPAILVDVDGPLNPFAAKPERRPRGYATHRLHPRDSPWEHTSRPLRVWLHPQHGRWLLDLAEDTGAELVWATTWEHEANRLLAPILGLPSLPVIDFDGQGQRHHGGHHGKLPAVAEWAGDRPIAWLDDEFQPLDSSWARQRTARGAPTLLVQVDPRAGVQPHHLDRIRRFLRTWESQQP